jgi:hypothetical protein
MKKWAKLLLFLLLTVPLLAQAEKKIWSSTKPPVNVTHIFQGEINRRGKPVGFHALFDGKAVETARIVRIKSKPNKAGVYTAQVEIYDRRNKKWKKKFSSMFPDDMAPKEIVKAVLHAYEHRQKGKQTTWRGPSGHGFPIEGYLLKNGKINTDYPIYIRDRKK